MASIVMKLKPWQVPNFATVETPPGLKQDGIKELPSIAVAELSEEALDDLSAQWLAGVYQKAGKFSPWARSKREPLS